MNKEDKNRKLIPIGNLLVEVKYADTERDLEECMLKILKQKRKEAHIR